MNKTLTSFLLGAAFLAGGGSHVYAHHAFGAEFDADKPITLKGKVTKIRWVNPHSWIYIDVAGEDSVVTNWAIEFGGPYSLLQQGLRRTDFPLGTEVQVDGFLAKSGDPVVNSSNVTLPDGRDFYTAAEDSPAARTAQ